MVKKSWVTKTYEKDREENRLREKGIRVGDKGWDVKKLKAEYRKEKFKEGVGKVMNALSKSMPDKIVYRRILKKSPQATVVYRGSNPNSHFKQEWEQEGKFLSWK